MRIEASTLRPWRTSFAQGVGSARDRAFMREGLVLALRDTDGTIGQGEASPLPGYSSSSIAECVAALRDIHMALPDPIDPMDPSAALDGLCAAVPVARFALETALYDLAAKHRGVPLSVALGGPVDPSPIALHAQLGAADDGAMIGLAKQRVAEGYATLKVKVGADWPLERDALQRLRDAVGPDVAIRLDANGAWSISEARARLAELRAIAPEFVEQPVAGSQVLTLGVTDTPWAADECLADPHVAEALLARDIASGCSVFVIKPFHLGGLLAARKLAMRAVDAGFDIVVTHGFEGVVGVAAACALALSLPKPPRVCGLGPHPALEGVVPYHAGAWLRPSALPGLPVPTTEGLQWT